MFDRNKRRFLTGAFGVSTLASGTLLTGVASLAMVSHAKDSWDMVTHEPAKEIKLQGDLSDLIEPDAEMISESVGKTLMAAFLAGLSAYGARGGYWMLNKAIKNEPILENIDLTDTNEYTRRDFLNFRKSGKTWEL